MPTPQQVVGTDGIQPVYDENGLWKIWSMHQIYTGAQGENRFVPKKKDYVIMPETFETFIVDDLSSDLIPTLVKINPLGMLTDGGDVDAILRTRPGVLGDTFRLYYDDKIFPHRLDPDRRIYLPGVDTYKIFRGTLTTEDGQVVSKLYDNTGNFVSEAIPLELASIDSHNNVQVKFAGPCSCTEALNESEVVTLVAYSNTGHVVYSKMLTVEKTSTIRSSNISRKYITNISLKSPFLSESAQDQVDYPLNIVLNTMNFMGVVHYSNGETLELPVDGNKFKLYGLDFAISSIPDSIRTISLSYSLSSNEASVGGNENFQNGITRNYKFRVTDPNYGLAAKLQCFPVFVDENNGYQLRWFLTNMERNTWFEVTDKIHYNPNYGAFNPLLYGTKQTRQVYLNLKDVNPAFKNFNHVQFVEVTLFGAPNVNGAPWTTKSVVDAPNVFGTDRFAKRVSGNTFNLSKQTDDFDTWLTEMYANTYPLYDSRVEAGPLAPTHFAVTYNGQTTVLPISDWNADITVAGQVDNFKSVFIRFIRRVGVTDTHLSFASLAIKP